MSTAIRPVADSAPTVLASADAWIAAIDAGLSGRDDDEVLALVTELEQLARQVSALQVDVMDEVEHRRLHEADGYGSAKVMIGHRCKLSGGEVAGREKTRRMFRALPEVRAALEAGAIGIEQVRLLARVHANRRVSRLMTDQQSWFVEQAQRLSFSDFEQALRRWERLVDQSGAEPAAERCHDRRDFTVVQDHFGLGWEIRGGCGSLTGAAIDEIFREYVDAEWKSDWEKARAEKGDEATVHDLPRTPAQRRADALWQIFQDAAARPPESAAPRFVHNIVWDAASYEQMLLELDGRPRLPLDPASHRCSTLDGVPLAPTEAILNSLVGEIRRVVVDAAGTVIDLGTARRFVGSARLAAQLQNIRCAWTGCVVRTSRCEMDHLRPHSRGGRTNPGNGAPLCGRHNRWKQKGFRVWRDPAGDWHTYRPDGTEID